MKRLSLIALIACLPVLAACNTIQGVGKDITKVGEVLESSTN